MSELTELINENKNKNKNEQKIQLSMDVNKNRTFYVKSDNVAIKSSDTINENITKLFE